MSRVLVVDDREENLLLLRRLFEAHGWEVEEASNGAEALARAVAEPPALVVSDLLMPVMDGYTLLRHWRADERLRRIPFVVYTSTYMDTKGEQLALDLGADAFIPKPFEPELFMGRILEIMDRGVIGEGTAPREPMPEGLLEGYSEVLAHKLEEKMAELQRAESQIEAREAHLRAIYDADPECVKVLSADGSLLEMNAAGLQMVEADSFEQVANKSVYPMIVEEDRDAFRSLSERVFAGESGVLEFRIVGLKGGTRWLKTSAAPLRNLSGKITGLLGITRDITSHKQAEETLAIRARPRPRFYILKSENLLLRISPRTSRLRVREVLWQSRKDIVGMDEIGCQTLGYGTRFHARTRGTLTSQSPVVW